MKEKISKVKSKEKFVYNDCHVENRGYGETQICDYDGNLIASLNCSADKYAELLASAPEMRRIIQGFLNLPTECNAVFLQRYYRWSDDAEVVIKRTRGMK